MNEVIQKVKPAVDAVRENALTVVSDIENGEVMMDFSRRYLELVEKVKEHGKKGSISLTVTIAPLSKFGPNAVSVSGDVKANIPKKSYNQMPRFIGKNNMLVKNDPGQRDFSEVEKSFNA